VILTPCHRQWPWLMGGVRLEHRTQRRPGASSMIRPRRVLRTGSTRPPRRWPPWASSRSAARGLPEVPAPPGTAHRIHPPAGDRSEHRTRRRPGAQPQVPALPGTAQNIEPVGSPGQQHDPATPVATPGPTAGTGPPRRCSPWASSSAAARGPAAGTGPPRRWPP